jgi:hypothetical protein
LFDTINKIMYGSNAPQFAERIWINPSDCFIANNGVPWRQANSAQVVNFWPFTEKDIFHITKIDKIEENTVLISIIRSCIDHWVKGVPWTETSNYKRLEKKLIDESRIRAINCDNYDMLNKRFDNLDTIFETVKSEGRVRTRQELTASAFREENSVLIHIGPKGELVLGGVGMHRFSIAYILGLPIMPAQIGSVHKLSIPLITHLR